MSENKALKVTAKWNWQKKAFEVHPAFWDDVKLADGAEITAVLTTDRNPAQLRFYWWFLGRIVDSGLFDGDKDTLDDYTRMTIGFGRWRPIASETEVLETAWQAAWQTFLTLTGMERLSKHFRRGIEAYVAATPPRVVFIPDSISMARCDGVKFNEYLRAAEKVWGERLGVDVEAIRRDAPPMDSGEAREREGNALNHSSASVMPPPEPDTSPTSLGTRLRALAESMRKDTPAEFDAAWAALKVTEEAKELYRTIPKELEAVKKLSAQAAGGMFNDVEYEEVLGKIVRTAV